MEEVSVKTQNSNNNYSIIQKEDLNGKHFAMIPEVIFSIFSLLDVDSLLKVAQVCKLWRQVSEDNEIWKPRFLSASLEPVDYKVLSYLEQSWKKMYLEELLYLNRIATQEVLISKNRGGFDLSKGDHHELGRMLSSPSNTPLIGARRDIPHFARNFGSIIWWMKTKPTYSPFQVISIPIDVKWTIRKNEESGKEWIEEQHRIWKAEPYNHKTKKMKIEKSKRIRKVVVDISSNELQLSEEAMNRLQILTKCSNREHLKKIPRDHCYLIQVIYELKERAGPTLKIVDLPIDVDWFLCFKRYEYISESFRIWPTPSESEIQRLYPNCKLLGNRLVSNLKTKEEWEKEKDKANTESFENFTDLVEESWRKKDLYFTQT